jgi:hypothetical protein
MFDELGRNPLAGLPMFRCKRALQCTGTAGARWADGAVGSEVGRSRLPD